jgi:hypothetical protein
MLHLNIEAVLVTCTPHRGLQLQLTSCIICICTCAPLVWVQCGWQHATHLLQARGPEPHWRPQDQQRAGPGHAVQAHGQEPHHCRDRSRPARSGHGEQHTTQLQQQLEQQWGSSSSQQEQGQLSTTAVGTTSSRGSTCSRLASLWLRLGANLAATTALAEPSRCLLMQLRAITVYFYSCHSNLLRSVYL